jgi:hypothetical protein
MIRHPHDRASVQGAVAVDQARTGKHFCFDPVGSRGQDAQAKVVGKGGLHASQGVDLIQIGHGHSDLGCLRRGKGMLALYALSPASKGMIAPTI